MNAGRTTPWMILGFAVGVAMTAFGVVILLGYLHLRVDDPTNGPAPLRYVFGAVLVLYGVYRIVITNSARLTSRRKSQEE